MEQATKVIAATIQLATAIMVLGNTFGLFHVDISAVLAMLGASTGAGGASKALSKSSNGKTP